jgi:hypothetical protein
MNFKDIPESNILTFLKLNNIYTDSNIYDTAIKVINSDNVIFTKPIQNWLTAFIIKDKIYEPIKNTDINAAVFPYYKKLFELNYIDKSIIIEVMSYLYLYIDDTNYLNLLPNDIYIEILYKLPMSDIKEFKNASKSIYNIYNNIIQDNYYIKYKIIKLFEQYYDNLENYSINELKLLYNSLYPEYGKVIYKCEDNISSIDFYDDDICKIRTTSYGSFFINKDMYLYYKDINVPFYVTNINIPVNDIVCYNNNFYILSYGKVFLIYIKLINGFTYEARSFSINKDLILKEILITNVLLMDHSNNGLYFVKIDGSIHRLNNDNLTTNKLDYNYEFKKYEKKFYVTPDYMIYIDSENNVKSIKNGVEADEYICDAIGIYIKPNIGYYVIIKN